MKVAIDAFRIVCEPQTSGAVYVLELAAALCDERRVEQVVLLLPMPPDAVLARQLAGMAKVRVLVTHRHENPARSWFAQLCWIQFGLLRLLREDAAPGRVDWLICPYHQTSLRAPRSIQVLTVIHDLCGLDAASGYRKWGKGYTRHMFNFYTGLWRADAFVTISAHTRETLIARFPKIRRRAAAPVYNAVRANRLAPSRVAQLAEEHGFPKAFFLAYAAPGPRKGTDITIRCWGAYRAAGGRSELVLIAGVAAARFWKDYADEHGVPGITWMSNISDEQRDALYAAAICLVFPSRCEGFGYPILESMRQGSPVIAWRRSPAAEVCGDVLPLLDRLDDADVLAAMRRYDALSRDARAALTQSLCAASLRFGAADLGRGFVDVMHGAPRLPA